MNAGDQGANEFVGRASELRQLTEAFEQTLDVHHSVIMVAGPSGIGKTALITQFLLSLVEAHPSLKVFKGRCYEFEPVPYKGLDTIADEIATHLQQLPADIVRAIVPEDGFLLARLFPSLRRVPAIRDAPVPPNVAPDAQEIRDGAFTALRHLLLRMGRRAPTVLWLDDVQWSDRDSATFIADLCSSPEPHSLLVLLSYRNDGMTANPTLSLLHQVFGSDRFFGECKEVDVKPLSAEESRRLMEAFVSPGAVLSETARAQIIGEAGGHPLFLQQLTQFATSSESEASGKFSLDDLEVHAVLRSHTAALSDAAREILALTCIAAHPPALSLLLGAVEAPEAPKSQGVVELLHRRLARLEGLPEVPRLEPYHDQIRSAVCAMLDPGERQRCHTRLARLLSAQPNADPQLLVYHYLQAGETQAAFEAAVTSADLAESQFAFDRAASFYQIALGADTSGQSNRMGLFRKLAYALSRAGRGKEAAEAFMAAAAHGTREEQFDLNRQAADQLMRSGYIDDAMLLFERIAQTVGVHVPSKPAEAVRGIVLARVLTRLRLLRPAPSPVPSSSETNLLRLELLRTGGVILNIADPVLATYFQSLHIREALRVREADHLAIALAVESSIRLAGGKGNLESSLALYARAVRIAEQTGDTNVLGLLKLLRAYIDYLCCDVPHGLQSSREAITFLKEHCTGVAWELTAGYVLWFWFLCWGGHVDEVREALPGLLRDGAARGDVNMEVSLRLLSYVHYWYLSLDRPNEYVGEARRSLERWSRRGYHLQNYGAMFGTVECYLYLGDYEHARQSLVDDWDRMEKSFILRWQTLRVMAWFLRGRVALASWFERPKETAFRAEVQQCARELRRMTSPWCTPMARALDAGVLAGMQRWPEAAAAFEDVAASFDAVGLQAYAAAARHVGGRLHGDEHGRELITAAADFLRKQNVRNPSAFLDMLLPGSVYRQFGQSASG